MTFETEPVIDQDQIGQCRKHDVYKHPAYGTISMSHPTGGNQKMFGSDVGQMGVVRIEISRAELHRDLSHDWVFGRDRLLCFEMTHSQFAQFITGAGDARGTPVTLRYVPNGKVEEMPQIAWNVGKQELFRKEIRQMTANLLEDINGQIDQLAQLAESGSVSKTKLKEIIKNLQISTGNAPSNMSFVVKSAEEALEAATSHAKIEVEAFIDSKTKALGLQSLEQLAEVVENRRLLEQQ